jgi:serpin B
VYRAVARDQSSNFALSPISIELGLVLAWAGAQGETERQMAQVMDLGGTASEVHSALAAQLREWSQSSKRGFELSVANAAFARQGLQVLPAYQELIKTQYGAALRLAPRDDRAFRTQVNQWVSQATRGRIAELLDPSAIGRNTELVLANAVYFAGKWKHPFRVELTKLGPFELANGEVVQVKMMHKAKSTRTAHRGQFDLVELEYRESSLRMILLVPARGTSLASLESGIDGPWISAQLDSLEGGIAEISMPRITLSPHASLRLKRQLSDLGMPRAFQGAAEFCGISPCAAPFYIDDVHHRVVLKVDEEGTVAAAATGVTMHKASGFREILVNHPFLFMIVDGRSKAILFIGRVMDPRSSG